ncbi:hypothetical protein CROQUDRAFT_652640 [Cronartium quercuum f. sp. fusiforme G11]|uniref:Uncharacterized protein n=1 Tax=Cronartium quercuum f. sp. fusiforme G11 TaxID=708437 RepID=A0A9P6TFR1_9BASI|nr:hypothetical protein CROQUDRAFT_652640 [Cronartium quercuum f. sp. fusiforme G11]
MQATLNSIYFYVALLLGILQLINAQLQKTRSNVSEDIHEEAIGMIVDRIYHDESYNRSSKIGFERRKVRQILGDMSGSMA